MARQYKTNLAPQQPTLLLAFDNKLKLSRLLEQTRIVSLRSFPFWPPNYVGIDPL